VKQPHVVTVAITVIGGGRTVISVVVTVVVTTIVSLIVGLMYIVQKSLALYRYSERDRMTASVTHAWLSLRMTVSRRRIAGKCMAVKV
jgi:hypothetical protein